MNHDQTFRRVEISGLKDRIGDVTAFSADIHPLRPIDPYYGEFSGVLYYDYKSGSWCVVNYKGEGLLSVNGIKRTTGGHYKMTHWSRHITHRGGIITHIKPDVTIFYPETKSIVLQK